MSSIVRNYLEIFKKVTRWSFLFCSDHFAYKRWCPCGLQGFSLTLALPWWPVVWHWAGHCMTLGFNTMKAEDFSWYSSVSTIVFCFFTAPLFCWEEEKWCRHIHGISSWRELWWLCKKLFIPWTLLWTIVDNLESGPVNRGGGGGVCISLSIRLSVFNICLFERQC